MFLSLKNALGKTLGATFRGLLDSFSGASAAYSLRMLSGAYTGHALRVRRATDNVEVDVGFNGGSVSSTSPVTNVSGENTFTPYSDSAWTKAVGSASFETLTVTGVTIGSASGVPYVIELPFTEIASDTQVINIQFTVTSLSQSWQVYPKKANGQSAVTPVAIQSGANNISFTVGSDDVTGMVIELASGSSADLAYNSFSLTASAGDTAATTLGAFITETATAFASNFEDGPMWGFADGVTFDNPSASLGGENDYLKITQINGDSGVKRGYRTILTDIKSRAVSMTFRYYIPSTNAEVTKLRVQDGSTQWGDVTGTTDQWTSVTLTPDPTSSNARVYLALLKGSSQSYTASNGTDFIAVKDIVITTNENDVMVETWYDQSGNSRDAVQTTTAEQPKLASSGTLETDANGKITMLFDGTDDDLDLPTTVISSLDSVSAFNVCSSSDTSGTKIALGLSRTQSSAKRHYLPVQSSTQFFHNYDAPFAPAGQKLADADTNQHLFSSVAGSSTAKGFFDGTEKFSQSSVSTYASNRSGGIGSSDGGTNWQGDISEIIIYNSDQTADFDAINTQIKSYYGIS